MSWIRIKIFIVPVENGNPVPADPARRFISQIRDDALYGTYGKLDDDYWKSRMATVPEALSAVQVLSGPTLVDGLNCYEFELSLASELFPPAMGGIQHLFGMLAGDLLRFTLPPIHLKSWEIRGIAFPDDFLEQQFNSFRREIANDVKAIRSSFRLSEGLPLLAFSFKPRVGFSLSGLREVATSVLGAGFNIVELDTRHLPLSCEELADLIDLASSLPDKFPRHVARLSLNLSMRTDLAVEAAHRLCESCPQPVILKVDGGLNGLSSVQAIRGRRIKDGRKLGPILTCYPLIQNAISRYVPADQYVKALASSGVDIIYPGGRPDIGKMVRPLEGGGESNHIGPVERYRELSKEGWPMLSVAGGIYPGQLQAFYELLGPDVAWFLGGGVSLHKDGPAAGAALCVQIAQDAANKKRKAGGSWSADIDEKLSEQADSMFKDRSMLGEDQLRFVSPSSHLAKVYGLEPHKF